jgi:DNA processing protein
VLDDDYLQNLELVCDRPPFVFVRGPARSRRRPRDRVIGTHQTSGEGLEQADRLTRGLAERGVTVVSALARGIDDAAHRGALAAGGRIVAVMGTGSRSSTLASARRPT